MKNLVLIVLMMASCTGSQEDKQNVEVNYDITSKEWEAMPDSLKHDWMYRYIYYSGDKDVQSMIKFAKNEIKKEV
jgi:hypothetical protein